MHVVTAERFADSTAHPAQTAVCETAALEFSTVYNAWFRQVFRWVRALGGPSSDTEDLVQDVFVVVQRKLDAFDGGNLAGWLYRIAERTVSDYRRRAWFRKVFMRPREIALDELPAGGATAEDIAKRREAEAQFYAIVGRMSSKWRESFVLFEVQGYSGEEIAALRGIPAATVRTHLHRARKEFLGLVAKERT